MEPVAVRPSVSISRYSNASATSATSGRVTVVEVHRANDAAARHVHRLGNAISETQRIEAKRQESRTVRLKQQRELTNAIQTMNRDISQRRNVGGLGETSQEGREQHQPQQQPELEPRASMLRRADEGMATALEAKRERRRVADRQRRANRTHEQRIAESRRRRERTQNRTAEQVERTRVVNAEWRENMSEDQRELNRAAHTQWLASQREEQTRIADRARQANQTEEQRERRRIVDRERRANRTEEQRQRSQIAERERRARMTDEQRQSNARRRRATAETNRQRLSQNARNVVRCETNVVTFNVGMMEYVCASCRSKMFKGELHRGKLGTTATFALCCNYGNTQLPPLMPPPDEIVHLYTDDSPTAKEFRRNIRKYNSALAFASIGVNLGSVFNFRPGVGPWVYKVNGQLYHALGTMQPAADTPPTFSQLYVYDRDNELENRHRRNPDMRRDTLQLLQDAMHRHNPYALMFRQVSDIVNVNPVQDVRLILRAKGTPDPRRYNLPTGDDIAMVIPQTPDTDQSISHRDVVLYQNDELDLNEYSIVHIDEFHQMYDPTAYPLLFVNGDCGFDYENGLIVLWTKKTLGCKTTLSGLLCFLEDKSIYFEFNSKPR